MDGCALVFRSRNFSNVSLGVVPVLSASNTAFDFEAASPSKFSTLAFRKAARTVSETSVAA